MRYYLLRDDINFKDRWHLGEFKWCDNWLFIVPPAEFLEPCQYTLDVYRDGVELDFTITEASGGIPVISDKAKAAIADLAEIKQPYKNVVVEPVVIDNKKVIRDYFVMIIETQIDCIDEDKSDFQKFEINDPVRPDRAGEYRSFFNLVIDSSKTEGHHIFRLKNYLRAIVVSEEVKKRFEQAEIRGVVFESVNGECRTIA